MSSMPSTNGAQPHGGQSRPQPPGPGRPAPRSVACPGCGRDDRVAAVPAVYAANTGGTGVARVHVDGVVSDGELLHTSGTARTTTALGAMLRPPTLPMRWWLLPAFGALMMAVCTVGNLFAPADGPGRLSSVLGPGFFFLVLAGTTVLGQRHFKSVNATYPQDLQRWRDSFYCHNARSKVARAAV